MKCNVCGREEERLEKWFRHGERVMCPSCWIAMRFVIEQAIKFFGAETALVDALVQLRKEAANE